MHRSAVIRTFIRGAALAALVSAAGAQAASPVVQLTEATGTVEYSRDGERWRPVSRAKYLFEGYQVRTGAGSSAVIVNEKTGVTRALGAETVIAVDAAGAELVQGDIQPLNRVASSQD
jgi:hypothetical protein